MERILERGDMMDLALVTLRGCLEYGAYDDAADILRKMRNGCKLDGELCRMLADALDPKEKRGKGRPELHEALPKVSEEHKAIIRYYVERLVFHGNKRGAATVAIKETRKQFQIGERTLKDIRRDNKGQEMLYKLLSGIPHELWEEDKSE